MKDLSQDILTELESRGASPKPRWYFVAMRALFWLLSAVCTVVGGIAFSVGWYVFFDNDGLHVTLGNILQVVPYAWLIVLALFVVCAYFGFRQTRKGYKYAAPLVIVLLLAASGALGLVLDNYDVGQNVHKYLLSHTDFYDGLIYSSEDAD
ncbi:MAG: hypothetical protein JWO43_437 [Candidatus Adlerbacteria bacterium]|nr:hypothetical protein [Candidatus Adlerbacteria bacterium]